MGTLLAKIDVKSAYRNISVHPDDRWLMGLQWDGSLYIDAALPFSLRSAPNIFTVVADAVEWMARSEGVQFVIHYLDDFLVMGSPASTDCAAARSKLIAIFEWLGLPVAEEKLCSISSASLLTLCSVCKVRLPTAKLEELQVLLRQWQGRKAYTRRELESLTGKLAHAAKVVRPGKILRA